jgi:hypothetical protein
MNPDERFAYAAKLIRANAREVEYLTVHEMAEDYVAGGQISDEDAKAVHDLIGSAVVTVTRPQGGLS